jgi:hypothetical protein
MFTSVCFFGWAGFKPAPDYFPAGGFRIGATLYLDTKGAPSPWTAYHPRPARHTENEVYKHSLFSDGD